MTFGIADAIGFSKAGASLVKNGKSDVDPDEKTISGYRGQVRDYLNATGVSAGLIVFATTGSVETVNVR